MYYNWETFEMYYKMPFRLGTILEKFQEGKLTFKTFSSTNKYVKFIPGYL